MATALTYDVREGKLSLVQFLVRMFRYFMACSGYERYREQSMDAPIPTEASPDSVKSAESDYEQAMKDVVYWKDSPLTVLLERKKSEDAKVKTFNQDLLLAHARISTNYQHMIALLRSVEIPPGLQSFFMFAYNTLYESMTHDVRSENDLPPPPERLISLREYQEQNLQWAYERLEQTRVRLADARERFQSENELLKNFHAEVERIQEKQDAYKEEIASLRLGVAHVARRLNLGSQIPGLSDNGQEASVSSLITAAKEQERGWNKLCIHILDTIEKMQEEISSLKIAENGVGR